MADYKRLNPFQPSTSPWDQSFTAGGSRGSIVFPSAVPPFASPLVPIANQYDLNIIGSNNPPIAPGIRSANVLLQTNNLTNSPWTLTNSTSTEDFLQAPDGTITGLKLVATGADSSLGQAITELDSTTRVTFSAHFKFGAIAGADVTQIGIYDGTAAAWITRAQVSWTGGAATGMASVGGTGGGSYIITDAGGGWYRCSGVTNGNVTYTNSNSFIIYTAGTGALSAAGDYVYVWGPQLESGINVSQYGAVAASRF